MDHYDELAERVVRVMEVANVEGASRDQTLIWMRNALASMDRNNEPLGENPHPEYPWLPPLIPHDVVLRASETKRRAPTFGDEFGYDAGPT